MEKVAKKAGGVIIGGGILGIVISLFFILSARTGDVRSPYILFLNNENVARIWLILGVISAAFIILGIVLFFSSKKLPEPAAIKIKPGLEKPLRGIFPDPPAENKGGKD